MNDYVALLTVIAIIAGITWVARHPVWRRCRCGRMYCTGCGKEK